MKSSKISGITQIKTALNANGMRAVFSYYKKACVKINNATPGIPKILHVNKFVVHNVGTKPIVSP